MRIKITIDRFEDKMAVLKIDNGDTAVWPASRLPQEAKEGSILFFDIKNEKELEQQEKGIAKKILNEILNIKQ